MLILQNYKLLVQWLGLEPFRSNNVKNHFNALCFLVVGVLNVVVAVGYFLVDVNDMKEAFDSVLRLGCTMTLTIVLHFLLHSDRFTSLEEVLQDIVDESEWEANQ